MAMVHSFLESYSHDNHDPRRILAYLNNRLCRNRIEDCFVTAIVAVYETLTGRLMYSSAGHPPMLRCRADPKASKVVEILDAVGGLPLGILARASYEQEAVELMQGDIVLLYTDGVTEARDPKDRHFGVGGLESAMCGTNEGAGATLDAIRAALARHQGNRHHEDDQTLVAMQIVE